MKQWIAYHGVCAAFLMLLGATSSYSEATDGAARVPDRVAVGTVSLSTDVGIYIAIERGYFRRFNIDVDLSTFKNSSEMVAPLGMNRLQVGGGADAPGLWNAAGRSIDVKAVADKGSTGAGELASNGLVVKAGSAIKSCADLKGKRISTAAPSNGNLHTIAIWLGSCGLSLNDVEPVIVGFPDVAAALQGGAIDAANLPEPLITIGQRKGLIQLLVRADEMRPAEQAGVLLFAPEFRRNSDLANRFMIAYLMGARDYREALASAGAPTTDIVDILVKYTELKDPLIHRLAQPARLANEAALDLATMRSDFDWYKARGEISGQVQFEDAIDESFQKYAARFLREAPDGEVRQGQISP